MHDLENELRTALRRKQAPGDFTAHVLARVEAEGKAPSWREWMAAPFTRWAVVATLFLVMLGAGAVREWRQRQERLAGEQAKQQVELALQIAGSKLRVAEAKIQQLSERP
jgi:hypothetical protein